jgi:hypothetical protein
LNWRSDYVVVVNQNDTKADLNGWVTLTNGSGTAYRNADLKLVAGDVNRVRDETMAVKSARVMEMAAAAPQQQFQEQAFFEYHLYTLQRKTNIKNNETKQISLLSAADVGIKKELVINGQPYYFQGYNNPGEPIKEKVGVYVSFKNAKENGLGQPLPSESNSATRSMWSLNASRPITKPSPGASLSTPTKSESAITKMRPLWL